MAYNPEEKLTTNFKLKEFLVNEDVKDLTASAYSNLKYRVAPEMEKIRKQFGNRPIHINSGYRSLVHQINVYRQMAAQQNKPFSLDDVPMGSAHLKGLAADFVIEGLTPKQVQDGLAKFPHALELGTKAHTHIDIGRGYLRFFGTSA